MAQLSCRAHLGIQQLTHRNFRRSEAADLRVLARLDDDGASPAVTPPQVSGGHAVARSDTATAIAWRVADML